MATILKTNEKTISTKIKTENLNDGEFTVRRIKSIEPALRQWENGGGYPPKADSPTN